MRRRLSWSLVHDKSEYGELRTVRGRWERDNPTSSDDPRFRHYFRLAGVRVRVPWLAWAMFS